MLGGEVLLGSEDGKVLGADEGIRLGKMLGFCDSLGAGVGRKLGVSDGTSLLYRVGEKVDKAMATSMPAAIEESGTGWA
jgi:hypothetical protein